VPSVTLVSDICPTQTTMSDTVEGSRQFARVSCAMSCSEDTCCPLSVWCL